MHTYTHTSPSLCISLCFSSCLCLCSCSAYAPPPSLSISVALTLPVTFFICDSGDSRSLILYFSLLLLLSPTLHPFLPQSLTLTISHALSLSLSLKLTLSLNLYLSEACSLAHTLSLSLSLSDYLSLCNYHFLSFRIYHFPWLAEIGSTRHASTPFLATQPFLPSLACQTLSGESHQRDWYYLPIIVDRLGLILSR